MWKDSSQSLLRILKWLLLATFVGVVVGVCDAVFLKLLEVSIRARNGVAYFYVALPFALYVTAVLSRKVAKAHKDYSTDAVIKRINAYQPVSFLYCRFLFCVN